MQSIPLVASPASLALGFDVGLNCAHPQAIAQWKAHALSCFPNEAAGFILTDGRFIPVENIHADPRDHFEFPSTLYVAYADLLAGVVHSHTPGWRDEPTRPPSHSPSQADMAAQISMDVPWGISVAQNGSVSDPVWWGDTLPIRPLIGRTFIHGITDCYSLVRDWHRLQGIQFDDVPRDEDWWMEDSKDLYMDLFESRGFVRVQRVAPKKGDAFICGLRSGKRNHAGVFISNDIFIHHPGDQLSLRSHGVRWRQKLDFLVRHKDLAEDG